MNKPTVFDAEIPLPDARLSATEKGLLGFDARYRAVHDQLALLLHAGNLPAWSKTHHGRELALCGLVAEQYPLVIFHGDVGTGKTATAECIANRLARESKTDEPVLFRLSSRVRGSGKVGEMGNLLAQAFQELAAAAGKSRRAMLVIDEGDSIGASRTQAQSHHEDKVAVNTLIQGIDDLRRFGGRVVVFLCTNRLSVLDAAVRRRASVVQEFTRPDDEARRALLTMDLDGLNLTAKDLVELVTLTGPTGTAPGWTYSDIRTRLYPAALSRAYPDKPLTFAHIRAALAGLRPSPVLEDAG